MPRKSNPRHQFDTVKAADTIDLTDYVLVHKDYLSGLQGAVREAHKRINDEWGGDTTTCACVYCSHKTVSGDVRRP